MRTFAESSKAFSLIVQGFAGAPATTDTTSGGAAIIFDAGQHNGVGTLTNMAADSNLFAIRAISGAGSAQVRFLLKADDGELHLGNTTLVALDQHDDAALLRAYETQRTSGGVVKTEFDKFVKYNAEDLTEIGILGRVTPEEAAKGVEPLWSITRHVQLLNGAVWQQRLQMQVLAKALEAVAPGSIERVNAELAEMGAPVLNVVLTPKAAAATGATVH